MYPAQRPVLGRGGSWGCSRSNANFGCYQVTLWWSTWFFFCWETHIIPQSNRSTDRQNNFPSNKVCNKKFYKVTQCKIPFQTFCTSIPRSFPVNLINLPFRSEEGEGQSQSITFSNKLYLQLIFSTKHQKFHHLGIMKSCFQNKLQKIFFFCCKWNKVKLQPPRWAACWCLFKNQQKQIFYPAHSWHTDSLTLLWAFFPGLEFPSPQVRVKVCLERMGKNHTSSCSSTVQSLVLGVTGQGPGCSTASISTKNLISRICRLCIFIFPRLFLLFRTPSFSHLLFFPEFKPMISQSK